MFWLKRLKSGESEEHWSLPYGDLMSLLLAIFVMIAAMSELKAGPQYHRMAGGVRAAFGFTDSGSQAAAVATPRSMTLFERLEQSARSDGGVVRLDLGNDESMAPCEIVRQGDRLVLSVSADDSFEPFGGTPKPAADRLLARLADYLVSGQGALEVKGYAGDGKIPAGSPYRDAWDLSYQRARAAAEALAGRGVSRDRLCVIAMGNQRVSARLADPAGRPVLTTSPEASPGASPRAYSLVIVVRAAATHAE
jgi:chemotaxis protein MotB